MPLYDFKDKETGEIQERMVSLANYDQFLLDNPNLERVHTKTPGIVSGINMQSKMANSGFNEVLSKIAEKHPSSRLADTHGNKTIKDIKTKEVVKKHIKSGSIDGINPH